MFQKLNINENCFIKDTAVFNNDIDNKKHKKLTKFYSFSII